MIRTNALVLLLLGAAWLGAEPGPVLLYTGTGADRTSWTAVRTLARENGLEVREFTRLAQLSDLLGPATLVVVAGTSDDLGPLLRACTPAVAARLRSWVSQGGSYLGLCGGAFLACRPWSVDDRKVTTLDLVPVDAEDQADDTAERIVPVRWGGRRFQLYFQAGPRFVFDRSAGLSLQTFATYADGSPAGVLVRRDLGRVWLMGPHPEADPDWAEGLSGGAAWTDTRQLLVEVLRTLASPP